MHFLQLTIYFIFLAFYLGQVNSSSWAEWWTYDGIAGPSFWGVVNPRWSICAKGKKQSPIDINPKLLLFDPNLKHLRLEKHRVDASLVNTGKDVSLKMLPDQKKVQLTSGPLSYQYTFEKLQIHFGGKIESGSEHTINGKHFDAEIQIMAYNSDLYQNISQATSSPNGLTVLSVFVKIGIETNVNPEFEKIANGLRQIRHRGQQAKIQRISLHGLLPETNSFMTYEGSLTQPGCHETVTWILMNKPLYITKQQMLYMRELQQGPSSSSYQVPVQDNVRPTNNLYHRVIRTNINFPDPNRKCNMERDMGYKANLNTKKKK